MARLAIVIRDARGGTGTTRTIHEHARRFAARGWTVDVIGERVDPVPGAEVIRLARWPFFSRPAFAWRADRLLEGYDVVHGHGDNYRQDVLSLHNCVHAAHEAVHGRPHDGRGVAAVHARMLAERRFKLLICNSELMRRDVIARFGVPREATEVVYPGHDPERFRPGRRDDVRRQLGAGEGDFLVGLITSGDFKKRGVDVFRAAMSRLPRLKSVVIGKGPGAVAPVPDVEKYYQALDLYVHPAHWEEFGQSVQEALACGVPVLTTTRTGASELMGPLHRSLLLDKVEPDSLAAAIERLAADPGLREKLRAEGPACVRGNDWERNFQATLSCYSKISS